MRNLLGKMEKPVFFLLAAVFFCQTRLILKQFTVDFNEWSSVYLYFSDLIILAGFWAWWVNDRQKIRFRKPVFSDLAGPAGAWAAFFVLAALSVFVADQKWLAMYGILKLAELGALFFWARKIFAQIKTETFWLFFLGCSFFQSIIAIGQFLAQKSLGLKYLGESPLAPGMAGVAKIFLAGEKIIRAYGLVPHPNILAAILMISFFGLAYVFIKNYGLWGWRKKAVLGGVFIVSAAALFLTFSRVVILTGLALLFFWFIWLFFKKVERRAVLAAAGAVILAGLVLTAAFWPYVAPRFNLNNLSGSQSVDLRMFYNGAALEMIKIDPWLGIGQGNFTIVLGEFYDLFQAWALQPVHNIYLLIAAENGLIGLAAFFWFLFAVWRTGLKKMDRAIGVYPILIFCFIMITGLLDHFWLSLQQGQIMFWLFLALLAALPQERP